MERRPAKAKDAKGPTAKVQRYLASTKYDLWIPHTLPTSETYARK